MTWLPRDYSILWPMLGVDVFTSSFMDKVGEESVSDVGSSSSANHTVTDDQSEQGISWAHSMRS